MHLIANTIKNRGLLVFLHLIANAIKSYFLHTEYAVLQKHSFAVLPAIENRGLLVFLHLIANTIKNYAVDSYFLHNEVVQLLG
ncbi:MAG: hypothetical protein AEth_00463 [Candidatus Argoarchaeum ethanivorans]|uniref:Uncharacterized protein n=1 Tax=Candidatus Argoarchaeum ethanivorans TaxID=2608793 RepID=A0A8B3S4V6_9EURY|nr:MAG: hypothetical protein AEth_00463 [Candidatus Argoarchaeum ethanivorans]